MKKISFLSQTWLLYVIPLSLMNGLLYFAIAVAGVDNIKHLFQCQNNALLYIVSVGAAVCYGMFTYKSFEFITLRPRTAIAWCLAILAPFPACSFLTAGIEGATSLSLFDVKTVVLIAIALFLMRTVNFIDGAVKFPKRLFEIKAALNKAFHARDYKNLICIAIIVYTAIGYSLSTTDSIYAASIKIGNWLGVTNLSTLSLAAYVSSVIGAFVGLPMVFYWTQRGIVQLTNLGVPNENGFVQDPTDMYTYIGLLASFPVILGSLGAATSSSAQVFGQLGVLSEIVRVSSAVIFAICGGVPGLSTLFRGFSRIGMVFRPSSQT
ncbi:MAG: hypothetical protein WAW86_04410 [Gammaproteobacteria bacterium]